MLSYIESEDFAGYDPYDALNSPFLHRIGSGSKYLRIGATQLLKRSSINIRPIFGIHKGHNPKGIGLFLWGYSKLFAITKNPRYFEKAKYLLDLLEKLKITDYSGNCWGYNFDWQSLTFMRPKGTPTIVNTSFIGHALLDCYELTGMQRALDIAISIKDFILRDLNRIKLNGFFCFSYTPVDTEAAHNANLLGTSILARLSGYTEDYHLKEAIQKSLDYSMHSQHDNGAWFYADTNVQSWIDSFHTGFILQALRYIMDTGIGLEYIMAYHKGVEFYTKNFFLKDGTPKYFHDRIYPIDIHSPAQAICFLCHEGNQYEELTEKIIYWLLENMYSGKGFFYFRKGRFLTNRIPYMRWSQAWIFHALTEYLLTRGECNCL